MRKKIARLHEIIEKGCMDGKVQTNDKKDEQKGHNIRKEGIPQSSMGSTT
jgi:hypothetical protein